MKPQVEEQVCWSNIPTNHRAPTKSFRLDSLQARQWLEYLAQLLPCGGHAEALGEFRDKLEDGLWLAHWKREYVVLELELTVVPSLVGAIASHEPSLLSERSLAIQEDILAALSKFCGWT